MVSISGVRGIVGKTLTPDIVVKYAGAFAQYCNRGKIIIGCDGRASGTMLLQMASSTLLAMGCDVVNIGVCPTPTVALALREIGASGGIAVTASHNPSEWNGMKFIGSDGMFLDSAASKIFWSLAESDSPNYVAWNEIGKHQEDESFIDFHIDRVLDLSYIDRDQIRARRLKVVVDCINAAGGEIVPELLRRLGCDVVEMNCDLSGVFVRPPEPVPENLRAVCARVKTEEADIGVVVDPDVDRLVLITEQGEPFGEEYTIVSLARFVIEKDKATNGVKAGNAPTIVVNLSTTRAVDDIARSLEANLLRTPVGEINVAKKMREVGALIGGEGSGGIILPALNYGRDAIVGIGLTLQMLVEFGQPLSVLRASLPQYEIVKSKIALGSRDPDIVLAGIEKEFGISGETNRDDGLKIDFPDSWVHLRKSNTEPIIRIIAEARTRKLAEDLVDRCEQLVLGNG